MRYPLPAILIAATLPLGACSAEMGENRPVEAPPATPVGEPVSCIDTNRIDSTRVHGDRVIDFEMLGGDIYRNTLPYSCSGLGFEERFGYETSIGRLCNTDTITVLRTGGINGPTCGLGEFVPVELTENQS